MLTDLPPEASDAAWYGLRAWSEQDFKITKRAGWQGHRTRKRDPERAARLWLAVATLWLLSGRGAADETMPASTLLDVTALCPSRHGRAAPHGCGWCACFARAGWRCWSPCCARSRCRKGALSQNPGQLSPAGKKRLQRHSRPCPKPHETLGEQG